MMGERAITGGGRGWGGRDRSGPNISPPKHSLIHQPEESYCWGHLPQVPHVSPQQELTQLFLLSFYCAKVLPGLVYF